MLHWLIKRFKVTEKKSCNQSKGMLNLKSQKSSNHLVEPPFKHLPLERRPDIGQSYISALYCSRYKAQYITFKTISSWEALCSIPLRRYINPWLQFQLVEPTSADLTLSLTRFWPRKTGTRCCTLEWPRRRRGQLSTSSSSWRSETTFSSIFSSPSLWRDSLPRSVSF